MRTRTLLRWLFLTAIIAGLFWLFLRRSLTKKLLPAFAHADWRWVAVAALLSLLLCIGACVMRLWTLIGPLRRSEQRAPMRLGGFGSLYLATTAAQNLLPVPAGEVMRIVQLHRLFGLPLGGLSAVLLIEKLIEALGLGLQAGGVACLGTLPRGLKITLVLVVAASVGGTLLALLWAELWARRRPPANQDPALGTSPAAAPRAGVAAWLSAIRAGARQVLVELHTGACLLRSPPLYLRSLLYSCLADAANACTVGLCLAAVGLSCPVPIWFLVVLASRFVSLFPITPGQFGTQEAAVVLVLSYAHVAPEQALSAALLYHGAHFIPVTLLGLVELRRYLR